MSAGDLMFTDDMMVTDGPAYRAIPEDEFKQIQDQIATLTRQRDLAVEALEWIASSLPQIGVERVWMMDHANKTLSTIKGSEK